MRTHAPGRRWFDEPRCALPRIFPSRASGHPGLITYYDGQWPWTCDDGGCGRCPYCVYYWKGVEVSDRGYSAFQPRADGTSIRFGPSLYIATMKEWEAMPVNIRCAFVPSFVVA